MWVLLSAIVTTVCCCCCCCFTCAAADNFTARYIRVLADGPKHQPRFLTFNTLDNGEIEIQMEFALPFLTIPVKKTVDSAWNLYNGNVGLANVNLGALIIAGGMIFGALVIIPFLSSLFVKNVFSTSHHRSTDDTDNNELWRVMTLIDQVLLENNVDTTSCMQRTVCWLVRNARNKLNSGQATSQHKLIDGLATNEWINSHIHGSAVHFAIQNGLSSNKCSELFSGCKVTPKTFQLFANKLMEFI